MYLLYNNLPLDIQEIIDSKLIYFTNNKYQNLINELRNNTYYKYNSIIENISNQSVIIQTQIPFFRFNLK